MMHLNASCKPQLKMVFALTYCSTTLMKPPRIARNGHQINLISARNSIPVKIDVFSVKKDIIFFRMGALKLETVHIQMEYMINAI